MPYDLIILRGVSGAGKSTVAPLIAPLHAICTADDYFMRGDLYRFNPNKLREAHISCESKALSLMEKKEPKIVVANTSTTEMELEPYYRLAQQHGYTIHFLVVEKRHSNTNVHNVPEETLRRQETRLMHSIKLR